MLTSYKKARHAAPSDGLSTLKKFTIVAVVGLAAAVSVMTAASDGKTAFITDEGRTYTVAADSNDINTVLAEAGITLNDGDETIVTENSGNDLSIEIKRAFSVKVTADGKEHEAVLTSGTVADAVEKAGVEISPNDFVTPAPETALSGDTQISIVRGVKVYLQKNGEKKLVYVPEGTVKNALEFAGCELCSEGNEGVKLTARVTSGMTLCVDEVLYRTTTKFEKIEPTVVEEAYSALDIGKTVVKQEGKEGKIEYTYKEKYVNGELTEKKESGKKVVIKPENKIVLVGTRQPETEIKEEKQDDASSAASENSDESKAETKKTAARSGSSEEQTFGEGSDNAGDGFAYGTLITGVCTAYNEINGITATGTTPKVGTVAVNPDVIPYGTRLYICSADGSYVYGYAIAEDTGTACMAGDIVADLYMNSEDECNAFGRQELNIYVLD